MPAQYNNTHNDGSRFLFLRTALSNMGQVGALFPSSSRLVSRIVSLIDFDRARCIIEYGAGTGVFSKAILSHCAPMTKLVGLELNECFHRYLNSQIADNRFLLLNENVCNLSHCLRKNSVPPADYIISGVPFTLLPGKQKMKILEETRQNLHAQGKLIMYQYSFVMNKFLKKVFPRVRTQLMMFNVPPVFIFVCSKE